MKTFTKLFNLQLKSVDEDKKSVRFVISTNQVDRYGEVVDQKSWNFKEYLKNPIVLWGHDSYEPENVLGTASDLEIDADGSKTYATLTFDTEINPKANLIFSQVVKRTLRTVSVGFRNHTFEYEQDTPVLKDNDLLEISVVPIPANAGAVALAYKSGELKAKDAKWMLDSMRKESELLEEQLKSNDEDPKAMEELKTQIAALLDAVTKLTEAQAEIKDKVAAIESQVAEWKPPEETDEEKQAREAKEAEEAAKNKPPAKGGDKTSPEPEEEEFDEDAELTPELQEQIDQELAEFEEAELQPTT